MAVRSLRAPPTSGLSLTHLTISSDGLDYRHGTGHGVGAFLCVHEGPQVRGGSGAARDPPVPGADSLPPLACQGVSFRPGAAAVPLQPGMSITNEPGYYEDGQFGIRIEDMHVVAKVRAH